MSEHPLAPSRREILGALAMSPLLSQPALASSNQARLMHRLLSNDPLLSSIPIIASNDHMQAEQGPLSNFGNSHMYPSEDSNVPAMLARFDEKIAAGGHEQGVITEWGRTTGGGANNFTKPPVTPERQGELLASDLETIFADPKVAAVSLYELFSWGGPGEMQNFGLFDFDLKPRPAVQAIRSLIA